jgi:hypothetical protein
MRLNFKLLNFILIDNFESFKKHTFAKTKISKFMTFAFLPFYVCDKKNTMYIKYEGDASSQT